MNESTTSPKKPLRLLVASYRALPDYSATSFILNSLLAELDQDEFRLVTQRYPESFNNKLNDSSDHPVPIYLQNSPKLNRVTRKLNLHLNIARIPSLARKIEAQGRAFGCQQVLGIYPNITFLGAAALAAHRLKVPFYIWLHNTMRAMPHFRFYDHLLRLERSIFRKARCIYTMSDSMRDFYQQEYPDMHVETLAHPFHLTTPTPPPAFENRPLRLLFTGGINESNRDALSRMLDAFGNQPEHYQIHISSSLPRDVFKQKYGEFSNLVYHGFVDNAALKKLEQTADVLLLPHGLEGQLPAIEYQTIFPTKTIAYMMANRVILAHVTPNSNIDDYLRTRQLAVIENSKNPHAIREALRQALSEPETINRLLNNCQLTVKDFDAVEIARRFREQICAA